MEADEIAGFVAKRILQGIVVVFGVAVAVFFIVRVIPGDPARLMAPTATTQALDQLRHQLGLDKSLPVQFGIFIGHVVHGDFGRSYYYSGTSLHLIAEALPYTLALTGFAIGLALLVSIPLGIVAAVWHHSPVDRGVAAISVAFQSMPNFWVALLLLFFVAVKTGVLPATGWSGAASIVLPGTALSLGLVAYLTRAIRLTLAGILREPFVQALRARGVSSTRIVFAHGLKNICVPILTVIGVQVGYLLGGAVVIEFIFNYPGLGLLTLHAVLRRDLPLIEGIVIISASIFVVVNILVDISYALIDPRLRTHRVAIA